MFDILKNNNIKNILSISAFIFSSQIGSGVFILPASLSIIGFKSLLILFFVGLIAALLTNIFAETGLNSNEIITNGFGEKIGNFFFLLYWFISWFSTVVLFKELIAYTGITYPYGFILEFLIWLFVTFYNIKDLNNILILETILSGLKIIPFLGLFIMFVMNLKFGFNNNNNFIPNTGNINLYIKLFLRCLWGFVGLETGNIIGKNLNVKSSERKIGTYIGISGVIIFYILSIFFSFKITGITPLLNNQAPYITIFQIGCRNFINGNFISFFIKLLVIIVLFGSINSWTISSGYCGYEGSKIKLLPKIFNKTNKNNVPYMSIILSSCLVLFLLLISCNNNIYNTITKFVEISSCFFLLIYGMCLLSYTKVYVKNFFKRFFYCLIAIIIFYSFFSEIYNNLKLLI
jgi:APA family basic amino acid/polyamine antiporter